jgi:hypothetical protein
MHLFDSKKDILRPKNDLAFKLTHQLPVLYLGPTPISVKVKECWSIGVLGLKAEMDLIFTLLPLVIRDPNMVYIFPLYQPFINPILHHSNTQGTINLLL